MKFLADVNIESLIVKHLRKLNYDVKWVLEEDPFVKDEEILEISYTEKRILLSNDKDFGELVFKEKRNVFSIILLRIPQNDVALKVEVIDNLINNYKEKIEHKFTVVSKNKVRFLSI